MTNVSAPKSVKALALVSLLFCIMFLAMTVLAFVSSDYLEYYLEDVSFIISLTVNGLVLVWTLIFSIVMLAKKYTTVVPMILMAIIYPIAKFFDHMFGWLIGGSLGLSIYDFELEYIFDFIYAVFERNDLFLYDVAGLLLYFGFITLFIASVISAFAGGYYRKQMVSAGQRSPKPAQQEARAPRPQSAAQPIAQPVSNQPAPQPQSYAQAPQGYAPYMQQNQPQVQQGYAYAAASTNAVPTQPVFAAPQTAEKAAPDTYYQPQPQYEQVQAAPAYQAAAQPAPQPPLSAGQETNGINEHTQESPVYEGVRTEAAEPAVTEPLPADGDQETTAVAEE